MIIYASYQVVPKKSRITDKNAGLEGVEGRGKPNRQVLISFVTIGMIAGNNFYNYFKDTCRAVKTKIQCRNELWLSIIPDETVNTHLVNNLFTNFIIIDFVVNPVRPYWT